MARARKKSRNSTALARYAPNVPVRMPSPQLVVIRTGGAMQKARRAGGAVKHYAKGWFPKTRIVRSIGLSVGSSAGKAMAGALVLQAGMPAPVAAGLTALAGYALGGQGGTVAAFGDGILATQGGDVVDALAGWLGAKLQKAPA